MGKDDRLVPLSWHEAQERFPEAIEALLRANSDKSEPETAFRVDLYVEGEVLWCEDRLVPSDSLFWRADRGWCEGEPDVEESNVLIIPKGS